jgi:hypothetical protein
MTISVWDGLKRPVLVGWSCADRVISDDVATHGPGQLAGINFVDAGIKADPALAGDNLKNQPLMVSEDLATNIAATRAFVHGCFSKQPTADDFKTMLSFNMMVPPKVRAGLAGRPLDATEMMSKLKLPVLVTHGAEDRNVKLGVAKYTASVIPVARLTIYEGIGHAPFYEDAPRFNTELAHSCGKPTKPIDRSATTSLRTPRQRRTLKNLDKHQLIPCRGIDVGRQPRTATRLAAWPSALLFVEGWWIATFFGSPYQHRSRRNDRNHRDWITVVVFCSENNVLSGAYSDIEGYVGICIRERPIEGICQFVLIRLRKYGLQEMFPSCFQVHVLLMFFWQKSKIVSSLGMIVCIV